MLMLQKPARAVHHLHGMVAGRAHQGEGPVGLALHDELGRLDGPPRADEVRVGDHMLHAGEGEVRPVDIPWGGQVGFVFGDAFDVEDALFAQLVLRVEQALLPFRMGGADGPVEGRKKHHAKLVLRFQDRHVATLPYPGITPGRIWHFTRMLRPVSLLFSIMLNDKACTVSMGAWEVSTPGARQLFGQNAGRVGLGLFERIL